MDAATLTLRISIHALREEGDYRHRKDDINALNFYPRPPRGGRLQAAGKQDLGFQFLSTPSARRAPRAAPPPPPP